MSKESFFRQLVLPDDLKSKLAMNALKNKADGVVFIWDCIFIVFPALYALYTNFRSSFIIKYLAFFLYILPIVIRMGIKNDYYSRQSELVDKIKKDCSFVPVFLFKIFNFFTKYGYVLVTIVAIIFLNKKQSLTDNPFFLYIFYMIYIFVSFYDKIFWKCCDYGLSLNKYGV